ncbi:MAG TPA: flagellar biosynthetic protein FliQ [Candidatus Limnocylindrales bacterium]|nr:flagellar biosynthetic protein FliQ [Candidatus Limnocylindrales bacterium]
MEAFDGLLRDALIVTALLTLPVLLAATAVGACVAILQAATQVQEQTLTMLPKIVAVGAMIVLFGRFGMELCARLFGEVVARIPQLVHG